MSSHRPTLMWLVVAFGSVLPTVLSRRVVSKDMASAPIVSESNQPGAVQKVMIVPDGYCGSPRTEVSSFKKLCSCKKEGVWQLKKRNGHKTGTIPKITSATFDVEVVQDEDEWFFKGPLNGFDDYKDLAIDSIKCKRQGNNIGMLWNAFENALENPRAAVLASNLEKEQCMSVPRVTFFARGVDKTVSPKIHAEVVDPTYCVSSKDTHYCTNTACSVKPMRPAFTADLSEVESALSMQDGTLIYRGAPNGWPAFKNLPAVVMCGKSVRDARLSDPGSSIWASPDDCRPSEIKLQEPDWTKKGWTGSSLGFVFWYTPSSLGGPSMRFGETDLLAHAVEGRTAVRVHGFAHRYKPDKSFNLISKIKDFYTYHAAVLVQWSDGVYSVIELAWLDGLGGYRGKSNWYEDKEASGGTELYHTMQGQAEGMIRPWQSSRSEIRVLDVEVASPEAFEKFLERYSQKDDTQRFYNVHGLFATAAEVTPPRSQRQIFEGLLRYHENTNGVYSEDANNCQTLQADLYEWLTGIHLGVFEKRFAAAPVIMTHKNRVACFKGPCDGR